MFAALTREACTHELLPNGIHHFVFYESSPAAVDEWVRHLENLYASAPGDEALYMLVDSCHAGVQPLEYTARRSHELNMRYPDRPETRTAFLYDSNFSASLGRNCILMLSRIDHDRVQFFPGQNRFQDAIDWLLAEN